MGTRKTLDAQFVGKVNDDAMKALGDVTARRKWADSKSGSPITANMLCAEIARLNIELDTFEAVLQQIKTFCAANATPNGNHGTALVFVEALAATALSSTERDR